MDDVAQFPDVAGLDPAGVLAAAEDTLHARRAAELADLRLLAHWAVLHHPDSRVPSGGGPHQRYGEKPHRYGGEGTPEVWDFSIAELAVARQVHPVACEHALADVLDLQHRLPRTWAQVESLACEAWVARRVATLTRPLSAQAVTIVDAAVAAAIVGQAPSRVLAIAEAKVIEADPEAHDAKIEEARRRRFVALGKPENTGLRNLIARVGVGEALCVDAMVDRVADILHTRPERPNHPEAGPPFGREVTRDRNRDRARAEAFGWLARPAELLQLLLTHQQGDAEPLEPIEPHEPAGDPLRDSRTTAFPADLLDALRSVDPKKLAPPATLYVHLHQAALTGVEGVARVEGVGPMLYPQVTEMLATRHVTIRGVVDLNDHVCVDAYEHPEAVRERVHLARVGDYFPYAAATNRRFVDLDHPTPYLHAAADHPAPAKRDIRDRTDRPSGQTGTHNSGPLTRKHHRIKTHAPGWAARQLGPGVYVWQTPHHLYRLVDHTGTHRLPPEIGAGLFSDDQLTHDVHRTFLDHCLRTHPERWAA